MNELGIIDLMLPAFAECLVLVGIHSYLGLHVIRRRVIFVDLALAQVAALGATVGFLFGMAPDSPAALIFSILFTFVGAAVFSVTRLRDEKVPQEAVIGLVYAIAAAVVILVVDRAPHGAEHIKEVMTGAILWVKWNAIVFAAAVYSGIGLFHYIFRKQFLLISDDPEQAYKRGMRVRFWDFLFYLSFGVVISISVRTAGVLLVFVFLVVPAITAVLITDRIFFQLIIGWTMGTLVSVLGLALSYWGDMPSGPTVVGFYGAILVVIALFLFVSRARARNEAFRRVVFGVAVTAAVAVFLYWTGHLLGNSSLAGGKGRTTARAGLSPVPPPAEEPEKRIEKKGRPHDAVSILGILAEKDEEERELFLSSIDRDHYAILEEAFRESDDEMVGLAIARHLAKHDRTRAACLAYQMFRSTQTPFTRSEALTVVERLAGRRFGFDTDKKPEDNRSALDALKSWLAGIGCERKE
jgi:zinc/manganese transport system permease protein